MSDRTARVTMSFEGNAAGDLHYGPEEMLAPYVRGGYMEWVDQLDETPKPKKAARGKVQS